ncbi:hypothetical protein SISSUDRAFT_1130872 [Sistotremastrum suecicum HHB10207 ss-3]|uniref:Uncharacterized protein n=1 Tax=Sistotremastrum suecicum HHB10207 ss-3 TaxID=1314776 RepID=A0A166AXS4_9AGAM|nr:hypothetical protein SISSUDRAFT_1130872 [Sistotremastrum suecicum HHB10207 ss-3]
MLASSVKTMEQFIPAAKLKGRSVKRKAGEDDDDRDEPNKKPRKEGAQSKSGGKKRLLNGEEQKGGLVIVRGPPAIPVVADATYASVDPPTTTTTRPPPPRSSSKPPSNSKPSTTTSKPSSRSSKASASSLEPSTRTHKLQPTEEPDADEDVRQMEAELTHLRKSSQSHARQASASGIDVRFPSSAVKTPARKAPQYIDSRTPIPLQETPQNQKNKRLREGRRSSTGMRGKRASTSLGNSSIITQPHGSVKETSFYKHIDPDLPEALRARQLLLWCATRTAGVSTPSSPSSSSTPLPPLSQDGQKVLKQVQDQVIKWIAEGRIETPVGLAPDDENVLPNGKGLLREHEQNVKNRKREDDFLKEIERCKTEDAAWTEVLQSYNTRQANTLANIESRTRTPRRPRARPSTPSAKGKEKEVLDEDWEPWDAELDEKWHPGVELARHVIQSTRDRASSSDAVQQSPIGRRMGDIEFQVDHLHDIVHQSSQMASQSLRELDIRFARLSTALSMKSNPPPPRSGPTIGPRPPQTDPRDLLRALAYTDAGRPGEAARRAAREVKRAVEGGASTDIEKVTPVPAAPRTPRRPATPKRSR